MTKQDLEQQQELLLKKFRKEITCLCPESMKRSISVYNELKRTFINSLRVIEAFDKIKELLEDDRFPKEKVLEYVKHTGLGLNDGEMLAEMYNDLYGVDEVLNITAHYLPQIDLMETLKRKMM